MRLALPRFISIFVLTALIIGAGLFWWSTHGARSAAEPSVYVALGASDAVGVGADHPTSEGWVPLVSQALPDNPQLINLGISGATLSDIISQELPVALDARPAWVTIWPGINDLRHGVSRETFAANLDALLEQLAQQTTARVVVLNMPDLRLVPAFASVDQVSLEQAVRDWNDTIARAAHQHNAILVDLYGHSDEIAGHEEDISSDGFHPSTAGYRRIADLVMKMVQAHDAATTP
jgi:lysophospholipase L1-like esterase